MEENQRGMVSIILVLIIISLLGIVVYFIFQNNQPKVKQTEVSQPDANSALPTTPPNTVINYGEKEIIDEVFLSFQEYIDSLNIIPAEGFGKYSLSESNLKTDGIWVVFTAASNKLEKDPDAHVSVPNIIEGIGYKEKDGFWTIDIRGYEGYYKLIENIPETILSKEAKEIILSGPRSNSSYNFKK